MRSLFTLLRTRVTWALLLAAGALLASCGGGGGSSNSATQYTSVAMAGELLTYTIDPVALTYSYTITESQFGLQGKTGSGTLVRNLDGSYSPSGIPNARIVILPNGLLLGAVRERFGTAVVTVPIIGLSNPVSTVSALAASYNFMHRGCLAAACVTDIGTFVIAGNSTWSSCPGANLGAGPCPAGGRSGTLVSLGNGLFQVMEGTANVGTAIGFNSAGQNVLLIDLKDLRVDGLGVGLVVGAQQATLTSAQTDGTWIAGTSSGHWAVFTASGTKITITSIDGIAINNPQPFDISINSPWQGIASTAAGGMGFLAGNGVYVLETGNGYAELGIKLR
ncbi:MAG TPA: hypothetical protein VFU71_23540 [Burkholderiaceae bacterium]|nr:hypothetical protein [Burkholderiaceae bacterium]